MDAKITITAEQNGDGFYVAQFKTAELAIFSYYLQSEGQVILIDPTYDTQVYQNFIASRKSTLKYVFLTHYHADFLSGHTHFKVPIVMGKNSKRNISQFLVQQQDDKTVLELAKVKIEVLHTPGHTLESSCYLLTDSNSNPACLFTGDTVFIGDVGRPDLAVKGDLPVEDLAGLLFESIQKIKLLQDNIRVYPAHGSGSACGKAIGAGNFCTLEAQKTNNYGFKFNDKGEFIKAVLNGLAKPPSYFLKDATLNQIGTKPFQQMFLKVNVPLSVEEFQALSHKLPVVDTRSQIKALIKGAYWLPAKGGITTWMTNLFPLETEFILFTEPGKWQDVAQRFLRIGYFNIRGFNNFPIQEWKGETLSPKIIKFEQVKQMKDFDHLDVRNNPQFVSAGIVQNSILIPLPQLPNRVEELRNHKNIVISCRSGLRARVAYSILARSGIDSIVFAETFDDFAVKGGLKVIPYKA